MKRALLLDFDGTLVQSLGVARRVFDTFMADRELSTSDAEFDSLNGLPLQVCIETLQETRDLEGNLPDLMAEWSDRLDAEYVRVPPSPGVIDLLEVARHTDWLVGIVTSAPAVIAENWLKRADLDHHITTVVGGTDTVLGKPHPDPYEEALRRLNCEAQHSIAVEDSPIGASAAVAAGLRTFVLTGQKGIIIPDEVRPLDRLDHLKSLIKNSPMQWHDLSPDAVVRVLGDAKPLTDDISAQVARIWERETEAHPNRYNGRMLSMTKLQPEGLNGVFIPFSWSVAALRQPYLRQKLGVKPVAVSAVTRCRDGLVLGRRGHHLAVDQDLWELAASGGANLDCLNEDGGLDLNEMIALEITEEIGLPRQSIRVGHILGIAENLDRGVIDVVLQANVDMNGSEVLDAHRACHSREYSKIAIVDDKDVPDFCRRQHWQLVDVTHLLLEHLGLIR